MYMNMSSVCVTHIVWASTNPQWGMKKTPTEGSITLLKQEPPSSMMEGGDTFTKGMSDSKLLLF